MTRQKCLWSAVLWAGFATMTLAQEPAISPQPLPGNAPTGSAVPRNPMAYSPAYRPNNESMSPVIEDADAPPVRRSGIQADYLLWRLSHSHVPALVTTGNPNDAVPGALGQPGTQVLFGDRGLDYGSFSGMRLLGDWWFDPESMVGVQVGGFLLEQRAVQYANGSDSTGQPALYVPIYRAELGREGSFMISAPADAFNGPMLGDVAITSRSQLWGGEVNLLQNLTLRPNLVVDVLYGFRYLNLDESLRLQGLNLNDPTMGIQGSFVDDFATRSQFFGGQIGMRFGYRVEKLTLDMTAKIALGSNYNESNVSGSFTQTGAALGPFQGTFPGGLLTQSTNIGHVSEDRFSVLPHVQLRGSYEILPGLRLSAGYDFLYWSQIVRAGSQVDHSVNLTQSQALNPLGMGALIGPARPGSELQSKNLIVHGVSFGFEYRY